MKKALFCFAIFFLIACQPKTTGLAQEIIPQPQIYFCQRQNCTQALSTFLENSQKSIHCALFELNLPEIITLLTEKSKSMEVKLVIDTDNKENLKGAGIVEDNRSAYMHNKFCIVDNEKLMTGSFNPTFNGAYKNNNNMIIIHSKHLALNYEGEFAELWNKTFGKGKVTENPLMYLNNKRYESYFCPEDHCADKIAAELEKANQSIYFMIFSFTHDHIATIVARKYHEGLDVKGVMEKSQNSKYTKYKLFSNQGMLVLWDKNPSMMHHKVFIIDNKTVITGSFNPSNNADKSNDENILIIGDKEIAQRYLHEFDDVWIESS